MNFQLLRKPILFEPGDENIWTDPYISQRMLEAHLNIDYDAASRKVSTFDVFSEKLTEDKKENRSWEYCNEAGFWGGRATPLGLSQA